jgi:hypothetical protein
MALFVRHLTAAVMVWIALSAPAIAKPTPEAARQLTFTVFAPEPIEGLAYTPQPGAPPLALAFYPTARSARHTYRGPAHLEFIDSASGRVRAEISLPARVKNALFILFPVAATGSGAARYRILTLDDDPSHHEPSTLRILNLSGLELSGTVNRRQITLHADTDNPIRVDGAATIELRTQFRGRSYQAYAETIRFEPSGRGLLLLLPPYRPGALEVQSRVLLDVRPPTVPLPTKGSR